MLHAELTEQIIGAFYRVYHALGWGFLEKVYHGAMLHELRKQGLRVETKKKFDVLYDGVVVGEYFADIVVEVVVIVELKAVEQLAPQHEAQVLNYLRASAVEVGLLFNFGPKAQFRRKVFDTARSCHAIPTHGPPDNDADPADDLFQ
jgi:GxxExxY protein